MVSLKLVANTLLFFINFSTMQPKTTLKCLRQENFTKILSQTITFLTFLK